MPKLDIIQHKILDEQTLERQLAVWKFKNRKIVFTNGCFDILHLGHLTYLSEAADLGDELIIGLNSDNSVKKLKGPERPFNKQFARQMALAAISFVSAVVVFDEDTPASLIRKVKPDVLVKGADYKPENIAGYDFVKSYGGEVVCIELVPGYSSTDMLKKINK